MVGEPEGRSRRRARFALLVALAVLVPGILIAAAVALGGQQSPAATVTAPLGLTPGAAAAAPAASAPARPKPSLSAIPGGSGALVATVVHPTNLLASPGGHAKIARLLTKTQFGSPEMLWVVSHVPGRHCVVNAGARQHRGR